MRPCSLIIVFVVYCTDMSLVTRKPVYGVFDQVWLKPIWAATEASYRLEISDIKTRDFILSRQWTTKVLIRLHECAGWSAPLVFAYGINRFSQNMAHIIIHTVAMYLKFQRNFKAFASFYSATGLKGLSLTWLQAFKERFSHGMAHKKKWMHFVLGWY